MAGASFSLSGVTAAAPPLVEILSPSEGAVYFIRQPVVVSWFVLPGSSAILGVTAPAFPGSLLDTSTVGRQSFTVSVTDSSGNTASKTVRYWVIFRTRALEPLPPEAFAEGHVPELEAQAGQVVPFAFAVTDFFDISLPNAVAVLSVLDSARKVVAIGKDIVGLFRYDSGSGLYRYALDTTVLQAGTYELWVQFNDGKTIYKMRLKLNPS